MLNKGTSIELAAEDFETPVEFVTVARGAQSTCRSCLKHRVLNEDGLTEAIHEAKPDLDARPKWRAPAAAEADLKAATTARRGLELPA